MPNKLPWMPFYGRDFFNDERVKILRMHQSCFYIYLLWHQWEEGSIPEFDDCLDFPLASAELYKYHRDCFEQGPSEESSMLASFKTVFMMFFEPHPTLKHRFINKRLLAIQEEQKQKDQINQERARKGGLAKSILQAQRKHTISIPQADLQAHLESANQSQIKKEKRNLKSPDKSVVHAIPGEEEWKPIQDKLSKLVKPFPS